jgi:alkaline phosphatase
MAHIALAETSSASQWVTDSAAGMTAIVTGRKTHNGVVAQSEAAVRGETDGEGMANDTLILFTADHSYDFRVHSGRKGTALVASIEPNVGDNEESVRLPHVRRDDDHTGEEVLVAAQGPGAARVSGILSNTDLFHIMMAAYRWN